ncbi:DUF4097 family beta strand repeat-containing protein [Luteimonas suaedae]|uniref:DUF4097 family beta strand repeat-containing protein n=1 Tax=Luteimonas suaedae TaxID=2605430 RepID=UPI0011EBC3AB|nr:DUF4097 family beta strand repeat-containing protein [Luteimonas suaedae]
MPIRIPRLAAATALLLALLLPASTLLAQTSIDERHPLASGGRVEVENVAGSIRVSGWDRDEVTVTGSLGEGQRLEVDASRNRVRIKVIYPRNSRGGRGAQLELRVPKGAELQASAVSADVDVTGVDLRRLQAKSVSGGVNVAGRTGEADLGSVSGAIRGRIATPRLEAGTVSGRIEIDGGVSGDVRLESVSGAISLTAAKIEQLRGESVSGGMTVRAGALAPGGRIVLESVSGSIGLQLPADASAQLRVSSFSGNITSDAGEVERPRYGPGRSLDTRLGGGDGDVSIKSHSGSVRVDIGGR